MKTIQMTIDEPLLAALDRATRASRTTRSAFIRSAVEMALRQTRVEELEARHAQGYSQQPVRSGELDYWDSEQDWGSP